MASLKGVTDAISNLGRALVDNEWELIMGVEVKKKMENVYEELGLDISQPYLKIYTQQPRLKIDIQ